MAISGRITNYNPQFIVDDDGNIQGYRNKKGEDKPITSSASSSVSTTGGTYTVQDGGQDVILSGGNVNLTLDIPAGANAKMTFANQGSSATSEVVTKPADQPTLRLSDATSIVTLPAITMDRTDGVGWTFMALVRVGSDMQTALGGSSHTAFVSAGTTFPFVLGYEGNAATAQWCLKMLMGNSTNAAATALRFGQNAAGAPFTASRLGKWIWIGARKHSAPLTETVLGTTGSASSVNFGVDTITIFWTELTNFPATGNTVFSSNVTFGGTSTAAASTTTSSITAQAVKVGTTRSDGGSIDVARVLFVNQTATVDQIKKLAACKRPAAAGMTVNNATDFYYVLNSLTASQMLDELGGTAATSAVFAGADGLTPSADRPIGSRADSVREPVGTVTTGELNVLVVDGAVARAY